MTRRSSPERRSSTMRRSSPLRRSTATSTTCCRRSLLRRRSSARRSLPLRRPAPIRPPSQNLSRRSPRTRQLRKTYAFGWLPLGCASSLGFRHLPPRSSITHRLRHGHPATGDVTERHAAALTAASFRPARLCTPPAPRRTAPGHPPARADGAGRGGRRARRERHSQDIQPPRVASAPHNWYSDGRSPLRASRHSHAARRHDTCQLRARHQ